MKRIKLFLFALVAIALSTSCERVQPNYEGVLMKNFGKNGKSDYTLQKGRVNTMAPGTELFQVPAYEQRADFEQRVLHLKAADNTEFTSSPTYSYQLAEGRAVDLVFNNSHLGSGDAFMRNLENNILETRIYDIMKEESRRYITDSLMAKGGSLKFEKLVEKRVSEAFLEQGLILKSFSSQLQFTDKVTQKIDQRNEVNTNLGVLDQKIIEQKKINELEELRTQQQLIRSRGITDQILQQEFIDKWDGKTPIYGSAPFFIKETR